MDEATRLIESGYRCISNKARRVSRLDRPDWREHMARDHTDGFPGSPEKNLAEGMRWVDGLGSSAADFYRSVMSKDVLSNVPHEIYARIKQAGAGSGWGGLDEYREVIPDPQPRRRPNYIQRTSPMSVNTIATIYHAESVRFDDTQALDEALMDGEATLEALYADGAATRPGWNGPFIIDANDEILIADADSATRVRYGSTTRIGTCWTRTVTETIAKHLVAGELVIEIMEDGQPAEYLVITPGAFDVREDF